MFQQSVNSLNPNEKPNSVTFACVDYDPLTGDFLNEWVSLFNSSSCQSLKQTHHVSTQRLVCITSHPGCWKLPHHSPLKPPLVGTDVWGSGHAYSRCSVVMLLVWQGQNSDWPILNLIKRWWFRRLWACLQQMFCCHVASLTGTEFWLTNSELDKEVVVHAIVGMPAADVLSSCCRSDMGSSDWPILNLVKRWWMVQMVVSCAQQFGSSVQICVSESPGLHSLVDYT